MGIESTRLRYVMASDKEVITTFLGKLPFKVEIKSITENKGVSTVWFVIPDKIKDFKNVRL